MSLKDIAVSARANTKSEGAECPVCARVAVAADDRHARLGEALLWADDVHDALVDVAHWVVRDAELGSVRSKRVDLLG